MSHPDRATLLTWHPPGYKNTEPRGWFGRPLHNFTFTGTEPEPTNPPWISAAYDLAYGGHPVGDRSTWDDELKDAVHRIVDEYEHAREVWHAARYELAVVKALPEVVAALQEFRRASSAAAAAYTALDDTPDNQWRATILRLTRARAEALAAGGRLDRSTYPIAEAWEAIPCRGDRAFERTRRVEEIAAANGMDVTGVNVDDVDLDYHGYYGSSPIQRKLTDEYAEQDKHIAEVTRLVGAVDQRD